MSYSEQAPEPCSETCVWTLFLSWSLVSGEPWWSRWQPTPAACRSSGRQCCLGEGPGPTCSPAWTSGCQSEALQTQHERQLYVCVCVCVCVCVRAGKGRELNLVFTDIKLPLTHTIYPTIPSHSLPPFLHLSSPLCSSSDIPMMFMASLVSSYSFASFRPGTARFPLLKYWYVFASSNKNSSVGWEYQDSNQVMLHYLLSTNHILWSRSCDYASHLAIWLSIFRFVHNHPPIHKRKLSLSQNNM